MNDAATELWQLAPTLAELRKLPTNGKDRLLLAKLARMSRYEGSVLNKHNLILNGDPYGVAHGFPDAEKQGVKEPIPDRRRETRERTLVSKAQLTLN